MKTVTSPIGRWPGTVTLSDPLTFPMVTAIEHVLRPMMEGSDEAKPPKDRWLTTSDQECLPVIMACVPEDGWHLENFTSNPFPASPRVESHKLIEFLFGQILKIYFGEEDEVEASKNE